MYVCVLLWGMMCELSFMIREMACMDMMRGEQKKNNIEILKQINKKTHKTVIKYMWNKIANVPRLSSCKTFSEIMGHLDC